MNFIMSPVGKILLFAAALTIWTVYQRDLAAKEAALACHEEQLRLTITEVTRQRDAAIEALDQAEEVAKRTDSQLRALEKDNAEAKSSLPKSVRNNSCVIPDSTAERLRNIK